MKRYQILLSFLLIQVVLNTQVSALTPSTRRDEVDEMMQAVNSALKQSADFSALQKTQISLKVTELKSLQANLDQLVSENEKLTSEQKEMFRQFDETISSLFEAIKNDIGEQIKTLQEKIRNIQEEIKKLKETAEKLYLVASKAASETMVLATIGSLNQSVEKARAALTPISQDRTQAARLLESIKTNNRTSVSELLQQNSVGTTVYVQEIKNTNGFGVVFKIGTVGYCLSTNSQCGGQPASISK
jgi:DNA repair exonuclease SbcCD ATPase subunit